MQGCRTSYLGIGSPRPSGLTIIELLVAISIVSLLVSLLLPAVNAAREAARKVHCQSNLRQFGIALEQYHDRCGSLPQGRMKCYDPRFSSPIPGCSANLVDKSFLVSLLPDFEQASLYNSINHSLTIFGVENRSCHTTSVALYACPSDPQSGLPRDIPAHCLDVFDMFDPPGGRNKMVFTSYVGISGSFAVNALPDPRQSCRINPISLGQNNGVFCDVSPIRFASVSDGLSNTAFMTERATTPLQRIPQPISRLPFEFDGWYVTGNWGGTLATSFYPINAYKKVASVSAHAIVDSASSLHPGGVNVLMGDGSVRFVGETINSWLFDPRSGNPVGATQTPAEWWDHVPPMGIWQAITTRSDGYLVSSDSF